VAVAAIPVLLGKKTQQLIFLGQRSLKQNRRLLVDPMVVWLALALVVTTTAFPCNSAAECANATMYQIPGAALPLHSLI
jgi:hypothetical protein